MDDVGRQLFETMTGEQAGVLLQSLVVLVAAFVVGVALGVGRLEARYGPSRGSHRAVFRYRFLLVVTAMSLLLATGAAFVLMMSPWAREQDWLIELAVTQAGLALALLVLGAVIWGFLRTGVGMHPPRHRATDVQDE